jgi:tetratricopeptide (TPR) repeat protein
MLHEAHDLRNAASHALARATRPGDTADLLLTIGRLSGVLAYAALDLGDSGAAMEHSAVAWHAADTIGHNGLRAWVRGTQSLIARYDTEYARALDYATDGLRYSKRDSAAVRLLCGQAQCHANMADSAGAHKALAAAVNARDVVGAAEPRGLFGFTLAKQAYYSGSVLIWLDTPADARQASEEATRAISLWSAGPPRERSRDDEALAHVYRATAQLQLGDLEAAAASLEPILGLPEDRRISWIGKRLTQIGGLLAVPPFTKDPLASRVRERIRDFGRSAAL